MRASGEEAAGVAGRSTVRTRTTCTRPKWSLLEEDVDAFDRTERIEPDTVDVLPKWDSYSMGYAPDGRQRFIDGRFLSLAYTSVAGSPGATSGDGLPLILKGGRAIGSWSHRFAGSRLAVSVAPFPGCVCDASFEAVGELPAHVKLLDPWTELNTFSLFRIADAPEYSPARRESSC